MGSIVKTVGSKLYIKDEIESHLFLMRFLIVLQFIAFVLNMAKSYKNGFDFISLIWLFFGILFTWFAYLYFYKYTKQSVFEIEEIKAIEIKKTFRNKEIYIKLKNNKTRRISKKGLLQEIAIIKEWSEENQLSFTP